jgi:AraC family transcriptional regulator of adaptative response/methylated-DNA-[protein]-cysteine methyltransferase
MNDYERIARVIRYLDENHADQPDLATIARYVDLSRFHLHRLFTSWAGVPQNANLVFRRIPLAFHRLVLS